MFDFDEKYLYPMGAPRHPHDGCGHPPPHEGDGCFPPDRPAFTLTEDMKHTIAQMNETIRHLVAFEKRIQSKYEETMKVLTSDNVLFKNTFANAHTLFVQEVKNEVNEFEGNIDASFEVFKTAIETDYKALLEKYDIEISAISCHGNPLHPQKAVLSVIPSFLSHSLSLWYNLTTPDH